MRGEAYSEPNREGSKQVGVEALASLPKTQLFHFRKTNTEWINL